MTRLNQAWQALMGTLEPEVREVWGPPVNVEEVTLYRVVCKSHFYSVMFHEGTEHLDRAHFPSCEAAFAAISGKDYFQVESEEAFKVGGRYFSRHSELKIQPKPKIAKGKRSNG